MIKRFLHTYMNMYENSFERFFLKHILSTCMPHYDPHVFSFSSQKYHNIGKVFDKVIPSIINL